MRTFALAALMAITLYGCNKNDGDDAGTLTAGSWQVVGKSRIMTVGNISDPPVNDYLSSDDCSKDDHLIFKSDMRAYIDQKTKKCYPADSQQLFQGTWELQENNSKLRIDNYVSVIKQMDKNTLVLETTHYGTFQHGAQPYTAVITTTYAHRF